MAQNPTQTELDYAQTIKRAFEDANDAHRVDIVAIDPAVVIPVVQGGLSVLGSFNIDFSSISSAAPFQITAGLASIVQQIMVADTTGQTDIIAFGSSQIFTNPGCERQYNIQIPASTAITIQSAETSDPTAGNYTITFLG